MDKQLVKVVQCNLREPDSVFELNARAYLGCHVDAVEKRAKIVGRSRSGRWVSTWVKLSRLHSFRIKRLPPEHPQSGNSEIAFDYWPDEAVINISELAKQ
jgi:hypothetical protein